MKILKLSNALIAASLISGCASHNIPDTAKPNGIFSDYAQAVVDQNGTFYPDNWEETYGSPNTFGAHSLKAIAKGDSDCSSITGLQSLLASEEKKISEIGNYLNNKERVFILIHGYNNDIKESRENYQKIREKLSLNENDGILEFHWDGLVSNSGILGDIRIWFNATGYSQLAGAEGLRDILNELHQKNIYIITHSRGASVALSALSNPPYQQDFIEDSLKYHCTNVNSAALKNNGNKISVLMLAPAVGLIDFGTPNQKSGSFKLRDLSEQLLSISYTVNNKDKILGKQLFMLSLHSRFNSTGLGYTDTLGYQLNKNYRIMKSHPIKGMKSHKFADYIDNPSFYKMLIDNEIVNTKN